MTRLSAPCSFAAIATLYVPKTLFSIASNTCDSISGTCLYAAAWYTTFGYSWVKTS